jgi:hypothetical protein
MLLFKIRHKSFLTTEFTNFYQFSSAFEAFMYINISFVDSKFVSDVFNSEEPQRGDNSLVKMLETFSSSP